MSRADRQKGVRGELEVAAILRDYGFHARRDGRLDDDLAHTLPGTHIEVKRVERLELYPALAQCEADAGDREPVLVFRRSRHPWRAIVELEHYLELRRELHDDPEVPL